MTVCDNGASEGFGFYLYRLGPARVPTPEVRVSIDIVAQSNVTWPDHALKDEGPKNESTQTTPAASGSDRTVAFTAGTEGEGAPQLVALESMAGSSSKQGGKQTPAFLVRSVSTFHACTQRDSGAAATNHASCC